MDSRRGTRSLGLVFAAVLVFGAGAAQADKAKNSSKKAAASAKEKAADSAKQKAAEKPAEAKPAAAANAAPAAAETDVPAPPPVVQRKVDPLDAALMQAMATTSMPAPSKKAKEQSASKRRAKQRAKKAGGLKGLGKFTRSARKARLGGRRDKQVPSADSVVVMDVQPLPPATVSAVIKKNAAKVQYCHESLASRGLASGGEVSVSFVVEPKGYVSSVKVVAGGQGARELEACMKRRILKWKFPAADAPTKVSYPFVFEVAGSALSN